MSKDGCFFALNVMVPLIALLIQGSLQLRLVTAKDSQSASLAGCASALCRKRSKASVLLLKTQQIMTPKHVIPNSKRAAGNLISFF